MTLAFVFNDSGWPGNSNFCLSVCSIAGSLGTPVVSTGLPVPVAPILGAAPVVPPVVAPLMAGSVPGLTGLAGAGVQLPASAIPSVDTIGIPSECLLLKNMFDPNVEVGQLEIFIYVFSGVFLVLFLFKFCLNHNILWQTEPDFDLDIKEDVQDECSKFGSLRHIYVDK